MSPLKKLTRASPGRALPTGYLLDKVCTEPVPVQGCSLPLQATSPCCAHRIPPIAYLASALQALHSNKYDCSLFYTAQNIHNNKKFNPVPSIVFHKRNDKHQLVAIDNTFFYHANQLVYFFFNQE